MSQKFNPKQFKRLNFSIDKINAFGIGISFDCWAISIQVPFFVIELVYFTDEQLDRMQKMANFFSENARELEE